MSTLDMDQFWASASALNAVTDGSLPLMDIIESSDLVLYEIGQPISLGNMDGAVLKGEAEASEFMANGGRGPLKVTALRVVDGEFAISSCFVLGGSTM